MSDRTVDRKRRSRLKSQSSDNRKTEKRRSSSESRERRQDVRRYPGETEGRRNNRGRNDAYDHADSKRRNNRLKIKQNKVKVRRQLKDAGPSVLSNITKIKLPFTLNVGVVVFCALFMYILILVFSYFNKSHITPYEVNIGSLAVNNTYMGVALRDEMLVKANHDGYINYYAKEGEKVANGSMVYTIDSTGKLSDLVNQANSENGLTDDDLTEIKNNISTFANKFNPINFSDSYSFKDDVDGTVLKLQNYKVLSEIDALNTANYSDAVSFGYAPNPGVLVYAEDGYENLDAEDLNEELMNRDNYVRNQFSSANGVVTSEDDVYKLITSENWSIVIEIDEARAEELENEHYVQVRFLENNYKSWGYITILHQDGKIYLKLDFNNSMITFAKERFIEIELLLNTEEGLKIPNSAIVDRAFYLIPEAYYTEGGTKDSPGFIRERYNEDGAKTSEFVDAEIYALVDGYYYVDEKVFAAGDILLMPESETGETYTISNQATLTGVYNINKGYADFKEITILNKNEEYSIVKSNTEYGLNVYDHIVLKGDTVSDKDFIYD